MTEVDVRAYLNRIGVEHPPDPDLETLRHLHERHLHAVPFENLDIHRGTPIVLERRTILDKLVTRHRGGFCYELNGAFAWLLSELGYRVTLLSARVARPGGGFGIPFDHMTLRVDLEDTAWLADVGFGECFVHPLPLDENAEGEYHLRRDADERVLFRNATAQYRFDLEPRGLEEFEDACRYHQSSPESTFTQRVVTTRLTDEGRMTLTRECLVVHDKGGRTTTPIETDAEWRRALEQRFHIVLEDAPCG